MTNSYVPMISIDYGSHPAFAPYENTTVDTSPLYDGFKELDTHIQGLKSIDIIPSPQFIATYFANFCDPLIQQMEQFTLAHMPEGILYKSLVPAAFAKMRASLLDDATFHHEKKIADYQVTINPNSKAVSEEMDELGYSAHQIPTEYTKMLFDAIGPWRQKVEQMRVENPSVRQPVQIIPLEGDFWVLVTELLRATGILDGISMHFEHQMAADYCALHLAHNGEDWFKDCYEDVGLPNSRHTYLHFDYDHDVCKVLIYLSDVGPDNGPFVLIPGSGKRIPSFTQAMFFREIEKLGQRAIREKKLAGDSKYYRPTFKLPELRKDFMTLPKELRGVTHIGDDIIEDTQLGRYVESNELVLTSDVANCLLFRGGSTLHRGGCVTGEDRWVFQIAFKAKRPGQ